MRIRLESYMNSGWVAFDDLSLRLAGGGPQLVPDPGFELDTGWSEVRHEDFPATSFYRGQSNTARPQRQAGPTPSATSPTATCGPTPSR